MQFVRRDRPRLADVEAQPVRRIQTAFLLDVRTQLPAQRLVQQVSGRVVSADRPAPCMIDRGHHRQSDQGCATLYAPEMHDQVAELFLRIGDQDV